MKKIFKAFGISVLYVLAYLGIQTLVLIPPMIYYVMKLALEAQSIVTTDIEALREKINAFMQSFVNITTIISALLTIGVLFLIFVIRKKSFLRKIEWNRISLKSIASMFVLGISLNFFITTLLALLPIPAKFFEGLERMGELINSGNILIDFVAIALAAPLIEEIIFRGCIFTTLRRNMKLPVAMVVQAVLFGVLHVYAISIGYAVAVGIIMAWAFVVHRSIWASIALHVSFNAASFGARWLPETNKGLLVGVAVLSACLMVTVFMMLARRSRHGRSGEGPIAS